MNGCEKPLLKHVPKASAMDTNGYSGAENRSELSRCAHLRSFRGAPQTGRTPGLHTTQTVYIRHPNMQRFSAELQRFFLVLINVRLVVQ